MNRTLLLILQYIFFLLSFSRVPLGNERCSRTLKFFAELRSARSLQLFCVTYFAFCFLVLFPSVLLLTPLLHLHPIPLLHPLLLCSLVSQIALVFLRVSLQAVRLHLHRTQSLDLIPGNLLLLSSLLACQRLLHLRCLMVRFFCLIVFLLVALFCLVAPFFQSTALVATPWCQHCALNLLLLLPSPSLFGSPSSPCSILYWFDLLFLSASDFSFGLFSLASLSLHSLRDGCFFFPSRTSYDSKWTQWKCQQLLARSPHFPPDLFRKSCTRCCLGQGLRWALILIVADEIHASRYPTARPFLFKFHIISCFSLCWARHFDRSRIHFPSFAFPCWICLRFASCVVATCFSSSTDSLLDSDPFGSSLRMLEEKCRPFAQSVCAFSSAILPSLLHFSLCFVFEGSCYWRITTPCVRFCWMCSGFFAWSEAPNQFHSFCAISFQAWCLNSHCASLHLIKLSSLLVIQGSFCSLVKELHRFVCYNNHTSLLFALLFFQKGSSIFFELHGSTVFPHLLQSMGSENSALVDEIFDAFYESDPAHGSSNGNNSSNNQSNSALSKMFTDYLPTLISSNQRAAIQVIAHRLGLPPDVLLYNNMHLILAHMLLHREDFVPCIQTLSVFFPSFNFAECVSIAIESLLRSLVSI